MVCLNNFLKIKQSGKFQSVYRHSRASHTATIVLFYLRSDDNFIGFTASKKVGNAVKRNFAKRRMRALFSEFCPNLHNGTYVLVAKTAIVETPYEQIRQQFSRALKKSKLIK